MASRIIRDAICSSPTLAVLSSDAERLWYRILTRCDDYGLFEADPRIVNGTCATLLKWSDSHVAKLLIEIERAGLVGFYVVRDRRYGEVISWARYNRMRAKQPKYPTRHEALTDDSICCQMPADDSTCQHMSVYARRRARASDSDSESESESEGGVGGEPQEPSPEVAAVCDGLLRAILAYKPDHRLAGKSGRVRSSWHKDVDLLIRVDQVTSERILRVLTWLAEQYEPKPGFDWRQVVQSGAKLRKHWDKLESMALEKPPPRPPPRRIRDRAYFDSGEAEQEAIALGLPLTRAKPQEATGGTSS